jgi:uncharacterized membrane protein YuzA (DUF378 family)
MKAIATLIGVVLLALGLAGFVPQLNPDGQLFGVMPMSTVMSVLFVITGIAGIAIGMSSRRHLAPPANRGDNDLRPWV